MLSGIMGPDKKSSDKNTKIIVEKFVEENKRTGGVSPGNLFGSKS